MVVKTKEELISEWRECWDYTNENDEEVWQDRTDLPNLYGGLEDDNGEWYHIINCMCLDTYGFFIVNEKHLKRLVNNAYMETCNVKKMLFQIARRVLNNKEFYKKYVDLRKYYEMKR